MHDALGPAAARGRVDVPYTEVAPPAVLGLYGDRFWLRTTSNPLMLQSRASLAGDIVGIAGDPFRTALYLEVEQLAPFRKALTGWPRVVPERTTSYGAREVIVRDPAGNVLVFSSRDAADLA